MALARRFASVTAVEIDEERAADLEHNLRAAGFDTTRLSEDLLPVPLLTRRRRSGGGDGGSGAAAGEGDGGAVAVLCGDAVQLLARLGPHDCFLLDPPWGGPAYLEAVQRRQEGGRNSGVNGSVSTRLSTISDSGSSLADGEQLDPEALAGGEPGRRGARNHPATASGKQGVIRDMPLGGEPLSRLCARLGRAGLGTTLVVLRLPSRGFDAEGFAADVAAACDGDARPAPSEAASPAVSAAVSSAAAESALASGVPLILCADLGRSRLLVVSFGGALRAVPPVPRERPHGRARERWRLRASSSAAADGVECWPLPEPCSVFVRAVGRFERCERTVTAGPAG
jgi:hypothetical protein